MNNHISQLSKMDIKKNKLLLIFLLVSVIVNNNIFSQSTTDLLNQRASIPIPSPNVAALNKFVEFPVSYFNGQVDISFPLYEIQLKNVTVPITLKCHTGGIRVSEEASWVGLGWALNAGGVISHQIYGLDDLTYPQRGLYGQYLPYLTSTENERYGEGVIGKLWSGEKIPNKNGQMEAIINKFTEHGSTYYDGQPDLYLYNFGQFSGKFIKWNNAVVDLNNNQIKFSQYVSNTSAGDSIIAITPDGVTYRFKNIETSFSITGDNSPEQSAMRMNTAAYYLSEITAPNGECVKFTYKTLKQLVTENNWSSTFPDYTPGTDPSYQQAGYFPQTPALFENLSFMKGIINPGQSVPNTINTAHSRLMSYTFSNPIYLDKIEFPNGSIQFTKSPRADIYGLELDRITVKDKANQTVKVFTFQYNYFEAPYQAFGTDVTTATSVSLSPVINYPVNYLKKRLKLLSFSEKNTNETQSKTYRFSYYENEQLPYKTSFAQDLWGFYNGQFNYTLLPRQSLYASNIPAEFGSGNMTSHATANRNVDTFRVKTASLKEITYPTSGKTTFELESNQCINNSIANSRIVTRSFSATDAGNGFGRAEFTLGTSKKITISVILGNGGTIPLYSVINGYLGEPYTEQPNGFYAVLEKYNPSRNRFEIFDTHYFWSAYNLLKPNYPDSYHSSLLDQELQPGRYRLTASFPDNQASKGSLGSTFANLYVAYDEVTEGVTSAANLAGGLRVNKMTQTDPIGNTKIEKKYTYNNGILATPPFLWYSFELPNQHNYDGAGTDILTIISIPWEEYTLSPNPIFSYSFAANGSLVGYRMVTETNSTGETGRTEYSYAMNEDYVTAPGSITWLPGIPPVSRISNGFMTSKTTYRSDNLLLHKQRFDYNILNAKTYWGFKIAPGVDYRTIGGRLGSWRDPVYINVDSYQEAVKYMRVYFYPIVQGRIVTTLEYEEDYRQGVIPPTQKTTNYEYNAYCQLTAKRTKDSSSKDIAETYKYVSEKAMESGGVYTQMKNKNILSPVIETITDDNGSTIKQVSNYSQPYTGIFTPSNFQLQFGNNPIETRITFSNYDKLGNPVYLSKDEVNKVIYLWGYNNQYPIAEIKNATYSQVQDILTSALISRVASADTPAATDLTAIKNLRTNADLSKAMVTVYEYKPLVGILKMTDPRGVVTDYVYDDFGQLKQVLVDGKKESEYQYHYKE